MKYFEEAKTRFVGKTMSLNELGEWAMQKVWRRVEKAAKQRKPQSHPQD
jgi:hypothetical protein